MPLSSEILAKPPGTEVGPPSGKFLDFFGGGYFLGLIIN